MQRRNFMLALPAIAMSSAASSKTKAYVEGRDYFTLAQPLKPEDPAGIEVEQFFAYPSPHSYSLEPQLAAWSKRQPSDVRFVKVHVSEVPGWQNYQRLYYTLVALKLHEKLDAQVFNAVQAQHAQVTSSDQAGALLASFGVDKATAVKTFDSFAVTSQMKQADSRMHDAQVGTVPSFVVDGRYRVPEPPKLGDMLKIVDFLVGKARASRAKH